MKASCLKLTPALHIEPLDASFWSLGIATSPPQLAIKGLGIVRSGLVVNQSLKEQLPEIVTISCNHAALFF